MSDAPSGSWAVRRQVAENGLTGEVPFPSPPNAPSLARPTEPPRADMNAALSPPRSSTPLRPGPGRKMCAFVAPAARPLRGVHFQIALPPIPFRRYRTFSARMMSPSNLSISPQRTQRQHFEKRCRLTELRHRALQKRQSRGTGHPAGHQPRMVRTQPELLQLVVEGRITAVVTSFTGTLPRC